MKVHKITLLVVDFDELGVEEVKDVLENVHYPNHCIAPEVMDTQTVEVEWDDDHPLNQNDTQEAEYKRLFG